MDKESSYCTSASLKDTHGHPLPLARCRAALANTAAKYTVKTTRPSVQGVQYWLWLELQGFAMLEALPDRRATRGTWFHD
jgi:hypothetical protein